jgi:hypothetical protein
MTSPATGGEVPQQEPEQQQQQQQHGRYVAELALMFASAAGLMKWATAAAATPTNPRIKNNVYASP